MSWFSNLWNGGLTSILTPIKETIDEFNLSDEEKNEFELQIRRQLMSVFSEIENTHQIEMKAKQEIMMSELNQGDSFTKRARPSIVYWGIAMITFAYVLFPLIIGIILAIQGKLIVSLENGATSFSDLPNIPLPEQFWWAWGSVVSVYAVGRSAEKFGVRNKIIQSITGNKQ